MMGPSKNLSKMNTNTLRVLASKSTYPTVRNEAKRIIARRELPPNMTEEILKLASGKGAKEVRRLLRIRKPMPTPNRKISKVSRRTSILPPNGPNITYAYKNKNWKYYVPGMGKDVLFFDENKTRPFKILKNGRRKYVSKNYTTAIIPYGSPRITQNKFKPRKSFDMYKKDALNYMNKLNKINNRAYRQKSLTKFSNANLIAYIRGHWRPRGFFNDEDEYEKGNNGKWYVGGSVVNRRRVLYNIGAAHGRA
jgi:hypothetical protein